MRYGNTYNVYRNGELIAEGIINSKLLEIAGINPGNITRYIGTGKEYKGKDGRYKFEYANEPTIYPKRCKSLMNENKENCIDPKFKSEWDKARFRINPELKKEEEIK